MTRIRSSRPFIHTLKCVECLKEGLEAGDGSGEGFEGHWWGCPALPGSKDAGVSPRGILSPRDIMACMGILSPRGVLSPRDILACTGVLSLRGIMSWEGGSSPRVMSCHAQGSCPQGPPCPGWGSSLQRVFCPHSTPCPIGCPVPTDALSEVGLLALHPHSMRCFPPGSHCGTGGHPWAPQPLPRDRRSPRLAPRNALPTPPPHGQLSARSAQRFAAGERGLGSLRGAWPGGLTAVPKPGLLFCCCGEKIGHQSAFEGEPVQIYWWPGLFGRLI